MGIRKFCFLTRTSHTRSVSACYAACSIAPKSSPRKTFFRQTLRWPAVTFRGGPRGDSESQLIPADEPTGNVHSAQGEEIMQLFKKLDEAGTIIIQLTHSERNPPMATGRFTLRW